MDWFILVIGLLGLNLLAVRARSLLEHVWVYAPLQLVNAVATVALAVFGLPGYDRWPLVKWVLAALIVTHAIQNHLARSGWARERRLERMEEEERARRERGPS